MGISKEEATNNTFKLQNNFKGCNSRKCHIYSLHRITCFNEPIEEAHACTAEEKRRGGQEERSIGGGEESKKRGVCQEKGEREVKGSGEEGQGGREKGKRIRKRKGEKTEG